ncbi:zf-HC2 domain-containing protein [Cohnella zeiphila]|uniref:Anti-sigma-W factor RsiW n=1 Tax=Cohnella zeiphila TaxID=2761120 RepID=A0A7X0ST99_9BACL|nr:zf-HC2 domain-containing protein [Cohnella zeiphila]
MKSDCGLIQERFIDYWDGTADSAERLTVEAHLAECPDCAAEFRLWEESSNLIRDMQFDDELYGDDATAAELNQNVMNRIYAEERWFMPALRHSYSFSRGFRLKIGGLLASLTALFLVGFMYTLYERFHASTAPVTGVMETADAYEAGSHVKSSVFVDVPVASLSDPIVLHVSPAMPEYWVAFSLVGVVMTLLILNWFTRVRA